MYTMPLPTLLQLSEMSPHEELQADGKLVVFASHMGKAAFVSHQWRDREHPDPECVQLRVLQQAFNYMLESAREIPVDLGTEGLVPGAKSMSTAALRTSSVFIWYDYFSCPQLDHEVGLLSQDGTVTKCQSELDKAVSSIPAYIARCSFFFALCPVVENSSLSKLLTPGTWASRGWCRAERTFRELSDDASWIMIKSATEVEMVISPVLTLGGSPGHGEFTDAADRPKLATALVKTIRRKLLQQLKHGDLVSYRVLRNLHTVHLRGLPAEPVRDLIPDFAPCCTCRSPVPLFLHEMGFEKISDVDVKGWSPLHYAALGGDPELIMGLLEQRADPQSLTKGSQPQVEMPPFVSALAIAISLKHHQAARLLLEAGAQVGAGVVTPPMCFAAMVNSPEGIRMLCSAGGSLDTTNLFGFSTFELAAAYGAVEALEEILLQANHRACAPNLSRALYSAMVFRGGSAELVWRLIGLQADVNYQWKQRHMSLWGMYTAFKSLQYRCGKKTTSTRVFSELAGSTPLMAAIKSGQYEGAAALITAGARLDIRNCHNRTAADWAQEYPVPAFLHEALEGDPSECQRICSLALENSLLEM
ncbi:ANK1 [Symbiodinium natans]|uniref:ANK1 protein n=1 Tax=Symbiodinium natans TaxID=878477 RepID=A0A812R467_9DINO|nr:ANK1 [Symbiodinium natans]